MSTTEQIPNRKKAAQAFFQEADQVPGFSRFDRLHGYVYGRWPYVYIGLAIGEKPWAKRVRSLITPIVKLIARLRPADQQALSSADGYHGKVVPLDQATKLIQVKQDVEIGDLEHIIPYPVAREIILKNPTHIVVLECPCRNARLEPCLPLDVCLIVGEPFASFILAHQPERARSITSAEAQTILQEEHERGHVHHAFFKDAMLGRFYAICNCCTCCCGAMTAQRNGSPMLAASGYRAVLDADECLLCEECIDACPFDVIATIDGAIHIDQDECMGCGVCVDRCQAQALTLIVDESRGLPLDIDLLIQEN